MLWYQTKIGKEVGPVLLKEQLSDKIAEDPEMYNLIQQAFGQTLNEFNNR